MDEMNSKYIEQGWRCPVCKAVMSPRERMCINCRGINLYGKVTTFPETEIYYDINNNQSLPPKQDLETTIISSLDSIGNIINEFDQEFEELKLYKNSDEI